MTVQAPKSPAGRLRSTGKRLAALFSVVVVGALLASCSQPDETWHGIDMKGTVPDLGFRMTRAGDGKAVSAEDFRGTIDLLYFGYTNCPDVCPLTLTNLAQALKNLGRDDAGGKDDAGKVRVLFVTVDPKRDTIDVMKQYAEAFGPQVVGLRGTDDQLAALAKRYRVAYSVGKDEKSGDVVVTHSSAVYAFDRQGHARLLFTNFSTPDADVDGMTADLRKLVEGPDSGGWFDWVKSFV